MLTHFDREKLIWESQLSSTEAMLLLALNTFVDADGRCWPGQKKLAEMCKVTDRSVRKTIASLAQKGILQKRHRCNNGRRTSDEYLVNFNRILEFLPEPRSSSQPEPRSANPPLPEPRSSSQPEPRSSSQPEPRSRDLSRSGSIQLLTTSRSIPLPPLSPSGEVRDKKEMGGEASLSSEPEPEQKAIPDQPNQELQDSGKSPQSSSAPPRPRDFSNDATAFAHGPWLAEAGFFALVEQHMRKSNYYRDMRQISQTQVKAYIRKATTNLERLGTVDDLWEEFQSIQTSPAPVTPPKPKLSAWERVCQAKARLAAKQPKLVPVPLERESRHVG